jgi:predicted nucleic acid-binding protein
LNPFILDACALIAVLNMETGADAIRKLFHDAANRQTTIIMNKFNFLEVYYQIYREYGKNEADKLNNTMKQMPIIMNSILTDDLLKEAGRIKAKDKISIADSVAVAETIVNNGTLVTSDHHEIEPVEKGEKISMMWFR